MAAAGDFVDLHCHLLPGVDDGPSSLDDALALAETLVADGVATAVVTPHQLGRWRANLGPDIRRRVRALQTALDRQAIPLTLLAGGDVQIEPQLASLVRKGDVLSLADRKKHVLLDLPNELFFRFDVLLASFAQEGLTAVLAHPERNLPIQRNASLLEPLVQAGCLLQVTAASLVGEYGPDAQRTAEDLLDRGWVQVLATDAHHATQRPPRLRAAFERAAALWGEEAAETMCLVNPTRIIRGERVRSKLPGGRRTAGASRSWLGWATSAFTRRPA